MSPLFDDFESSIAEIADSMASRLAISKTQPEPWPHVVVKDLLSDKLASELRHEILQHPLRRAIRQSGTKTYQMDTCTLLPNDNGLLGAFVRAVDTPIYRAAVEALLSSNITSSITEVNAWRYGPGDWLSPHVDKHEKKATQIIYLSPARPPEHGSSLVLSTSPDPKTNARKIAPVYRSSVLFAPNPSSWHSVEQIAYGQADRLSLTINYVEPEGK